MAEKYKPQRQWYVWVGDTHTQNSIVAELIKTGEKINPLDPFNMVPTKKGNLPMIPVSEYYAISFAKRSKNDIGLSVKSFRRIGEGLAGEFTLDEIRRLERTKKQKEAKKKLEKLKKENVQLKKELAGRSIHD